MSGCIIGNFGFQRSGKTLMAYLIAEQYRRKGCKVYTNMITDDFINIKSLDDIPLDYEPKVLLLDEAYYFMDSRLWKNNTNSSIFFNTIGKQNIMLIITAISPDTIEKRVREQLNYVIFAKGEATQIHYKILDVQRKSEKTLTFNKTPDLFNSLKYDTLQVPDVVDIDLKDFKNKVQSLRKPIKTK